MLVNSSNLLRRTLVSPAAQAPPQSISYCLIVLGHRHAGRRWTSQSHGTLTGTTPNLTYWLATNFFGTDEFGFKASDGRLESAATQVSITVQFVNDQPTVTLTRPTPGTQFLAPTMIALGAAASDVDGAIRKVEFFVGGALLGESAAAPFRLSWIAVVAGRHTLSAKATDNAGSETMSGELTVTVLAYLRSAEVLADGSFRFRPAGEPGRSYVVEVSADLACWTPRRRTRWMRRVGWWRPNPRLRHPAIATTAPDWSRKSTALVNLKT